jgi:hypothetical protein
VKALRFIFQTKRVDGQPSVRSVPNHGILEKIDIGIAFSDIA